MLHRTLTPPQKTEKETKNLDANIMFFVCLFAFTSISNCKSQSPEVQNFTSFYYFSALQQPPLLPLCSLFQPLTVHSKKLSSLSPVVATSLLCNLIPQKIVPSHPSGFFPHISLWRKLSWISWHKITFYLLLTLASKCFIPSLKIHRTQNDSNPKEKEVTIANKIC